MKNILKIKLIVLGIIMSYSCSKDDPDAINQQEYISNVVLEIQAADGSNQTIDWDISEQNSQSINLNANVNYNVEISFLNNSDPSNIEKVTLEVIEEADEHQVFYEFAEVSVNITSASDDTKDGSRGILIKSIWNASSSGSGIVRVYLIHQPTNLNATTREGFGGFNDVAIDIPVTITD
jgi:hypothetical protein